MPFDTDVEMGATSAPIIPDELGLHVFFCDIHPYMFATVIVVDPIHTDRDPFACWICTT
jgi:hypothetical protein